MKQGLEIDFFSKSIESSSSSKSICKPEEGIRSKPSILLWLSASVALLHGLSAGLFIGYPSAAIDSMASSPQLQHIDWSDANRAWVTSIFALGACLGSLVAGPALSNLGPRRAILINSVPFLTGWILAFFSTSLPLILIGRVIGGFSIGFSSGVVPVYVLEISTESLRGKLGISFQVRFVNWPF